MVTDDNVEVSLPVTCVGELGQHSTGAEPRGGSLDLDPEDENFATLTSPPFAKMEAAVPRIASPRKFGFGIISLPRDRATTSAGEFTC
jgi:hypothetical protein